VGAAYGGGAVGCAEFGEDAFRMRAQGVQRDVEPAGDLRAGELGVEESQYVEFPLGQGVRRRRRCLQEPAYEGFVGGRVLQQCEHRRAFVQEQTYVPVGLRCRDERVTQGSQCIGPFAADVKRKCPQYVDLQQTACPP
jgi:hypothetical protein